MHCGCPSRQSCNVANLQGELKLEGRKTVSCMKKIFACPIINKWSFGKYLLSACKALESCMIHEI